MKEIELFDLPLTDEQADMLKYFMRGNGLSLMGTGMGKTYATLCSFAAYRELYGECKMIVIGNKNSMNIWRKEISTKTPFSFTIYTSQDKDIEGWENSDIFITQYNLIKECVDEIEEFTQDRAILVVDEVHKAKSPLTELTQSVKFLIQRTECIWGLTATLMNTHLEDIYYLMEMIFDNPFRNISRFRKTYIEYKHKKTYLTKVHYREVIAYKNLDQLHSVISEHVFMRFKPMPLNFKYLEITMTEREEYNYALAAQGVLGLDYRNFVARLSDLQLVVDNAVAPGRVLNKDLKNIGAKEQLLLDVLEEKLLEDKAVIIYTFHTKSLRRLKYLIETKYDMDVYTITGDTSEFRRRKIEEVFKKRDVVIMTGAGGESLNLQASGVLIFYSLSFSVITFIQVVGRIARMDSTHEEMEVYILETTNSIDTYKKKYLEANSNLVSTVTVPNPNLPRVEVIPSKKYIMSLRRKLLWRVNKKNVSVMAPI